MLIPFQNFWGFCPGSMASGSVTATLPEPEEVEVYGSAVDEALS